MTVTTAMPAGTWVLDPARTAVAFSGRASRFAPTFRAAFSSVTGSIDVDDSARLTVDVDVTSMTTGNASWDEVLRQLDPFDARRCPTATYRGRADLCAGDRAVVHGDLELRGVLAPVILTAVVRRTGNDVVVTAGGSVDRRLFGVSCDLPGLGRLVPTALELTIEVTAVRAGMVPQQR
jgi:polyisoprenoid-binding protein YceI